MINLRGKDGILSFMINICTRVVTVVFIVATLVSFFTGNKAQQWSISDIWGVIIIGIISGLVFGLIFIKRNISKFHILFYEFVYFIVINAFVLRIGLKLNWFSKDFKSVLIMESMFILIFIVVYLMFYRFEYNHKRRIVKRHKDDINLGD